VGKVVTTAAPPLQQELCLALTALQITTKTQTPIGPPARNAVIAELGRAMAVAPALPEVSLAQTALRDGTKILTAIKRLAKRAHRANINPRLGRQLVQIVLRGDTSHSPRRRAANNVLKESIRVELNK